MPKRPVFFFVHVMKTGGTTFIQHLEANFPESQAYPYAPRGPQRRRQYTMVDELRNLDAERRSRIRAYSGHFPFVTHTLVDADVTLSLVREPVERTVSTLRHFKRYDEKYRDMSLEAIYDDPWVYPVFVRDYQAKLFAMTLDDKLESHMDVIDVDDRRLGIALANLDRVDVLGTHDRYGQFVEELSRRFGWSFTAVPDMRVSTESWDVSPELRRRIAADNAADVAFYDRAVEICADRRES